MWPECNLIRFLAINKWEIQSSVFELQNVFHCDFHSTDGLSKAKEDGKNLVDIFFVSHEDLLILGYFFAIRKVSLSSFLNHACQSGIHFTAPMSSHLSHLLSYLWHLQSKRLMSLFQHFNVASEISFYEWTHSNHFWIRQTPSSLASPPVDAFLLSLWCHPHSLTLTGN